MLIFSKVFLEEGRKEGGTGVILWVPGRDSRDLSVHPDAGREEVKSGFRAWADGELTPFQRGGEMAPWVRSLRPEFDPGSRLEVDTCCVPIYDCLLRETGAA